MNLIWTKEPNGAYVAQGVEEDTGDAVELVIEREGTPGRPWVLRAAGGYVGACKTVRDAKHLGHLYCERGLNTEDF